jgi:succinoglycan biosynthesis protein ExoV
VADGAILARNFVRERTQSKRFGVSYIPHGYTSHLAPWKLICEEMGINFISPRLSVEDALHAIGSSDLLLAEAMHGAILADALRVPWIPVVSNPKILSFKWRDWCESMGLGYDPVHLIQVWDPPANRWSPSGLRFGTKKLANKVRISRALRYKAPSLSADDVLDGKCTELERRLHDLKSDIASQRFPARR